MEPEKNRKSNQENEENKNRDAQKKPSSDKVVMFD